ncbi:hypothetical protein [Bizionia arctica]|uniref:Uncharacterized protein n=1 Tax=Bizionia arctica TaxID=1495645 RepID=A0A917GMW3_9FLAO|nr:hypothetical protein [Bizionia arctica]GGG52147.1 hypothetical protein GCM10010976_24120 [Bizionia arctica]
MLQKLNKPLIISGVSILAGFYLCIFIKKITNLSLNSEVSIEINPLEILTTLITVSLAIYVTRTLGKQNDLEKTEKISLIQYLTDFKDLANEKIYNILKEKKFGSPSTNSDLKVLRKKASTIINLGQEFNYFQKNEPLGIDLNNKVRDIWELLTDCPDQLDGRTNKTVQEGIDRIRLEQINKVETSLIDLEKIVFSLTMLVNKK